jgi:hypothetical protein
MTTPATITLVLTGSSWLEAFVSLPPGLQGVNPDVDDVESDALVGAVVPDGRRVTRLVGVEQTPYPCGYDCCGVGESRVEVEVE